MDIETCNEIISMLPSSRTRFDYFAGRYALFLLSEALGEPIAINKLRASALARLLDLPLVRPLLKQCGSGVLSADQVQQLWPLQTQPFLLGLDTWSGPQMSRAGSNLVQQLNFSQQHIARLLQTLGIATSKQKSPTDADYFNPWTGAHRQCLLNYAGHPYCRRTDRYRETLAWARLDIDFAGNCMLIEEIQSDFVRLAADAAHSGDRIGGAWVEESAWKRYAATDLKELTHLWAEAMLCAALWFARRELGLRFAYVHTAVTGALLKGIRNRQPPRSLYTTLPERFCMRRTREPPAFLRGSRRVKAIWRGDPTASFYRLDFQQLL